MTEANKNYESRNCFVCKVPIEYRDALFDAEGRGVSDWEFEEIWRSENIELLCCGCMNFLKKNKSSEKIMSILESIWINSPSTIKKRQIKQIQIKHKFTIPQFVSGIHQFGGD